MTRNGIFKVLPHDYDFFPRSFLIPSETVDLQKAMEAGPRNATYNVKVVAFPLAHSSQCVLRADWVGLLGC